MCIISVIGNCIHAFFRTKHGFEISKLGTMCNSCENSKNVCTCVFPLFYIFLKIMNMCDHYNKEFADIVIL